LKPASIYALSNWLKIVRMNVQLAAPASAISILIMRLTVYLLCSPFKA
jgi:hypothetical protein